MSDFKFNIGDEAFVITNSYHVVPVTIKSRWVRVSDEFEETNAYAVESPEPIVPDGFYLDDNIFKSLTDAKLALKLAILEKRRLDVGKYNEYKLRAVEENVCELRAARLIGNRWFIAAIVFAIISISFSLTTFYMKLKGLA